MSSSPNSEQETAVAETKQGKKLDRKNLKTVFLGIGKKAYIIAGALGVFLIILAAFAVREGSIIEDVFINLGASLVSVAAVFLVVERFFEYDPIGFMLDELETEVDRLESTIEEQLEALDIIEGEEEVYAYLTTKLQSGYWPTIRIFAPFSLADLPTQQQAGVPNQHTEVTQSPQHDKHPKLKWFDALRKYAQSNKNCSIYAVFGLPNPVSGETERKATLERLDSIRKILEGFTLDNVALYHIPPSQVSMGLGFVLFEDSSHEGFLVTGLASQGHSQVADSGISVKHRRALRRAATWFDRTLIGNELANFRLHGARVAFDKQWKQVEGIYRGQLDFQRLEGSEDIYSKVTSLNQDMKRHFRTFVVGRAKSPETWTRDLVKNLKEGSLRQNITIIAVDFQRPPDNLQKDIEHRLAIYEEEKVRDRITVKLLDMRPPIGQDIAIIDEQHVFISPFGFGDDVQVLAYVYENNTEFAKDYIEWFNKLADEAITYEEWLQKYGQNDDTQQ